MDTITGGASLKIIWFDGKNREHTKLIGGRELIIGRSKKADIYLNDNMVSIAHAIITVNGGIFDNDSTNGVIINNEYLAPVESYTDATKDAVIKKLEPGMEIICGNTYLCIKTRIEGDIDVDPDDMSMYRDMSSDEIEKMKLSKMGAEEYMEYEFSKIVGQDTIKRQLRDFYKQAKVNRLKAAIQGKKIEFNKVSYHMLLMGPPGTGKTTIARIVSGVMYKLGIIENSKLVEILNPLELLGGTVGSGPKNTNEKIDAALGGVIFVDEAYQIVKPGDAGVYGKEIIDTMMAAMLPPRTTFIFAGYPKEMGEFLKQNAGLERRIIYRYILEPYTIPQLAQIVIRMASKEDLESGVDNVLERLFQRLTEKRRNNENAGLAGNLLKFARDARNQRITLSEIEADPSVLTVLTNEDFENGMDILMSQASS